MQFLYKLFVSEKEVVNKLPIIVSPKLTEKKINSFIKSMRRLLFFEKIKKTNKFSSLGTKHSEEYKKAHEIIRLDA